MASYYVWSGATGSANGTSWANAYTTLTLAFSGKAAGDVFYVAHDHAESTASAITLTTAGTIANPSKVICVNRAGSVPPVSADRRATATVTTTGGSNISFSGATHYDGVIFTAGSGSSSAHFILPSAAAQALLRFDNCSLRFGANAANTMYLGNGGATGGAYIQFNNTTVSFSNVGQTIDITAVLEWRNTPSALIGTAVPNTLFSFSTPTRGGKVECIGVDLSAAGSGKTLVGFSATVTANSYRFIDCKLNAAVTKSSVPASLGSSEIDFLRSGATGINYTVYRHRMSGELMEETTIVRTGGALG